MKEVLFSATINGLDEWNDLAGQLLEQGKEKSIWCLKGDLGAGKTTLIQAFCRVLGIKEQVNSPTFALVQEYQLPQGGLIAHFDLYRLKSGDALLDIGWEHYLEAAEYLFVEWPELALPLLGDLAWTVEVNSNDLLVREVVMY